MIGGVILNWVFPTKHHSLSSNLADELPLCKPPTRSPPLPLADTVAWTWNCVVT